MLLTPAKKLTEIYRATIYVYKRNQSLNKLGICLTFVFVNIFVISVNKTVNSSNVLQFFK